MEIINNIKKLYGISDEENHGYDEKIVVELEKRLDITLPKVLRDYYLQLGKNLYVNETEMLLMRIDGTSLSYNYVYPFFSDDNYFCFCRDVEEKTFFGIRTNDLEKSNPIVYVKKKTCSEWNVIYELDKFLLFIAYENGVLGGLLYRGETKKRKYRRKRKFFSKSVSEETIKVIENNWKELYELSNLNGTARYFTNDNDEILRLHYVEDIEGGDIQLNIGSSNQERIKEILNLFNEEWNYWGNYNPEMFKTAESCLMAVQRYNDDILRYIPDKFKTEELCLTAVEQYSWALKHIPETHKTAKLCLAAIYEDDWTFCYIPESLKNVDFCFTVIQHNIRTFRFMPDSLKTEELCLAVVQKYGDLLRFVPETLKTAELCLIAVQGDGAALKYVPEDLKTAELCLTAVQENGGALFYVPEAYKTRELCNVAVQNWGLALLHVPEALKTSELCLTAVQKNGHAIQYVPEALKTEPLCLAAVQNTSDTIKYIPKALMTEEICIAAVQKSSWTLRYVPEDLRTERLCLAAVQEDERALQYVPEALQEQVIKAAGIEYREETMLTIWATLTGKTLKTGLKKGEKANLSFAILSFNTKITNEKKHLFESYNSGICKFSGEIIFKGFDYTVVRTNEINLFLPFKGIIGDFVEGSGELMINYFNKFDHNYSDTKHNFIIKNIIKLDENITETPDNYEVNETTTDDFMRYLLQLEQIDKETDPAF